MAGTLFFVIAERLRTGGDYSDEARLRAIYFAQLTENIEREIMAGSTQYGPHKDDIEITIDGHEARLYGSQDKKKYRCCDEACGGRGFT